MYPTVDKPQETTMPTAKEMWKKWPLSARLKQAVQKFRLWEAEEMDAEIVRFAETWAKAALLSSTSKEK